MADQEPNAGGPADFKFTAMDIPTPDAPEFYADGVWVRWNPYGFDLQFGQGMGARGPETTNAVIHMSPQLALVLSDLLAKQVAEYVERVGQLPPLIPPKATT